MSISQAQADKIVELNNKGYSTRIRQHSHGEFWAYNEEGNKRAVIYPDGSFHCEVLVDRVTPEHLNELSGSKGIETCRCTTVKRTNNTEVIIRMPNGGHIRLVSDTPISAYVKPESDRSVWEETND